MHPLHIEQCFAHKLWRGETNSAEFWIFAVSAWDFRSFFQIFHKENGSSNLNKEKSERKLRTKQSRVMGLLLTFFWWDPSKIPLRSNRNARLTPESERFEASTQGRYISEGPRYWVVSKFAADIPFTLPKYAAGPDA